MACETRYPACEAGLTAGTRQAAVKWLAWTACGWALLAAIYSAGCSSSSSRDASGSPNAPLLWGADAEGGAPFLSIDPNDPDKYVGFEVDLKDELSKRIGRPIKFHSYSFSALAEGLERGDFDFAMNGLEDTAMTIQTIILKSGECRKNLAS